MKDTPFERRTHESTGKHQGNLKRFLRDIQNNHERGEREKEQAKAEVGRLNKTFGGESSTTSQTDASKSSVKAQTASARKAPAPARTAADQQRQWEQLEQMGIKVPESRRAEMATASDWSTVSLPKPDFVAAPSDALSIGVRKRKLDPEEQAQAEAGELDEPARKTWGKSVRQYPGKHEDSLDDLLAGTTVTKQEKDQKVKQEPDEATTEQCSSSLEAPVLEATAGDAQAIPLVKTETDTPIDESNKPEDAVPVFKKRKGKQARG